MKKLIMLIGVVLSIVFLWLALKDTNFAEIKHAYKNARLWPMVPMLLTLFGFYWLKAMRWSVLLSPSHKVSGTSLVPAMMAGAAGNNLLPAHFGELVRAYFAGHKFGIPKSTVLATLVVERLFDVITVLLLFSVALLAGDYSSNIVATAVFLFVAGVVITIASVFLMLYTEPTANFIEKRFTFIPLSIRQQISEQLINLGTGLSALKAKNLYLEVIVNSIFQWLLMAGCLYSALLAFDIPASPFLGIIILGLTVAGLTLPTSPGFFGTIEYCFVLGLATIGVDASTALSAAIYYHIPAWITVTLAGLLLLRANNVSLRDPQVEAA